jgi:hypothetical protein
MITSLKQMEQIVSKHSNLCWVGWDIADRKKAEGARTSVNGVRVDGQWYLQRVYPLTEQGWDIPRKYRR